MQGVTLVPSVPSATIARVVLSARVVPIVSVVHVMRAVDGKCASRRNVHVRIYVRTTIVPIVPIVLFCTRASLPVRILTYVRTHTRGNLNTHARTTRGNMNTYARTAAEAIETSTHV